MMRVERLVFVEHPLLREGAIERREFQTKIAEECLSESTLVVLPTGLGKTVIAIIVIAETLAKRKGKILFLAPTKPLVDQHAAFLGENLRVNSIATFTGEIPPERRRELWEEANVIVSTPQVIENDIDSRKYSLESVSLVVFDETHRAVGDYAYVDIGRRYREDREDALVLGMTASPGHDLDKIAEVCRTLEITNIAVRSEDDEDVAPYVYGIAIEFVKVDMPEEVDEASELLGRILDERVKALRKYNLIDRKRPPNTRDLLEAGNVIRAKLNANRKNFHLYRALTDHAIAMKVNHAIDLARSQGMDSLRNYVYKLVEESQTKEGSRASKQLVKDARFEMVRRLIDSETADHPKLDRVREIISDQLSAEPASKMIVFTHYRDTCDNVVRLLGEIPGVKPVRFVGQATHGRDAGLKQKEQKEIVKKFKKGDYNVLVATSVAEEGLDIPATDLVVFYEPIPSEIRTIQRRGRTGRHRPGRVIVLLARGSKDEIYNYSSKRKERKMRAQLESLRRRLGVAKRVSSDLGRDLELEGVFEESQSQAPAERRARRISKSQTLLSDFGAAASSGLRLIANVEGNQEVVSELKKLGLKFGDAGGRAEDFAIGDDVAIIRESVDNFLTDLERPGFTSRVALLRDRYRRPMVVVEGRAKEAPDMETRLPIYDVIVSLIRDLGVPVVPTNDASDTAAFIVSLIRAEMAKDAVGSRDSDEDIGEYQKRMIQGLPNITSVVAERLLEHFGSVQRVMSATPEELMAVRGVGRVIADGIRRIATERYDSGSDEAD